MKKITFFLTLLSLLSLFLAACHQAAAPATASPRVLVVESFLADIAQHVAGDRLQVETLMPLGIDPHTFQPTPQDLARIADSQVLIVNGAGFEEWLEETIANAGGERLVIEASAGLTSRQGHEHEAKESAEEHHQSGDPHFWLDPVAVVTYVENIRHGLAAADPAGQAVYTQNAAAYIAQLNELDTWIQEQVSAIPAEKRLIVTNHESFGYFADRYGFQIIGAIIPSVSTGAAPSAQELAGLVDQIRATGASAIFLETGANPKLAEQLAQETGVKVISELYTHSVTAPDGVAPTYIDMMKHNVETIVEALIP